ncbi:Hexaprenyldihydroxybenzoate methyltransferase, mitochondrial-like protein [Gossypium australe]|uniref:Hexaprenyldihydroxybenzoate methyltransferase, mitochondrial-like protein n=1 Tax=Gossypium australe TaxID=47621 RepID=A0A5B6VC67_9ROSI|nr:Hexaprenyldihydroxybenzoate methyltransferase, mitochondrial-like protein [Gossypium australe]
MIVLGLDGPFKGHPKQYRKCLPTELELILRKLRVLLKLPYKELHLVVEGQGLRAEMMRVPVDKIRKYGAEEFRSTTDDDAEKAKFWLENTIRVFDELSCSPADCLKCTVSLLKDTTYYWWKIITSVVSKENITWEFFQTDFRKKYICQRFLDQKRKEFLELK